MDQTMEVRKAANCSMAVQATRQVTVATEDPWNIRHFARYLYGKKLPTNGLVFGEKGRVHIQIRTMDMPKNVEKRTAPIPIPGRPQPKGRASSNGVIPGKIENVLPSDRRKDNTSAESKIWDAIPVSTQIPADAPGSLNSEAVESASFTPPIGGFVQVNGNGPRVLLPPPGFGPGTKGAEENPEPLTFCRKKGFKKPDTKLSGISLSVAAQRDTQTRPENRPQENRVRFQIHEHPRLEEENCPAVVTRLDEESEKSKRRETLSSGTMRDAEAALFFRVFAIEEDLVYGRDLSTF